MTPLFVSMQVYSREFLRCNNLQHSIPDYPVSLNNGAGTYLAGQIIFCGGQFGPPASMTTSSKYLCHYCLGVFT